MTQLSSAEFQVDDESWFPVPFDGASDHITSAFASGTSSLLSNGPGRQLEELFAELGIPAQAGCGCRLFARRMDAWGVDGCHCHFEEIVDRLRQTARRYSRREHWFAASRAARSGLLFSLNPWDPFPGLVREAIRRAEEATSVGEPAGRV